MELTDTDYRAIRLALQAQYRGLARALQDMHRAGIVVNDAADEIWRKQRDLGVLIAKIETKIKN